MRNRLRLSLTSIRQLATVITPFFKSERKKIAWGFLGTLLGLLIVVSGINVIQSFIARDFMSALSERRAEDFSYSALLYLISLSAATVTATFYRYTEERLALAWREWMTSTLLHRYLTSRNYYRLRGVPELDNPDQRIAEDVRNFTATSLSLFLIAVNSLITLIAFMGVLASISWTLVWALFIYTILGTFFTLKIGRKLVRIYNRQYTREANFRYGLVRIRDNAESIAFFRGERRERLDVGRRFRDLVRNTRFLISWNRNLGFFTTGFNNLALILPTLIVAPAFLKGQVAFGVVTQAAGAFSQVLAASAILITQFERVSAYAAGVSRVNSLWGELTRVPDDEEPEIKVEEGTRLKVTDLTITPPNSSRELVRDLSLSLKPGTSVLIMGASGTGKSSILRTIAGLWSAGSGSIQRPNHRDMMFLPQKPYMPPGSLRAELLYPGRENSEGDKRLAKVLSTVNLSEVFKRVDGKLDSLLDWSNVLSLGEQQRISFARLLLSEPTIAFLDEATSALDEDNETQLYETMRKSKLTFVSVGHRSTLIPFHDFVLRLEGEGKWSLEKVQAAPSK